MRAFFVLFLMAIALPAQGQLSSTLDDKSAKGTFYVSVDDAADIYINGKKFFNAGLGESRSSETELKTRDRVVVHLRDDGGGRRFMMLFASTDGQTVISFRSRDFKNVMDLDVTDFTSEQFQRWTRSPKIERGNYILPVKSYSEWIWGDLNQCILACIVTPRMFTQKER